MKSGVPVIVAPQAGPDGGSDPAAVAAATAAAEAALAAASAAGSTGAADAFPGRVLAATPMATLRARAAEVGAQLTLPPPLPTAICGTPVEIGLKGERE